MSTEEFVGGYRIDLENREELAATATKFQAMLSFGDLPERVDIRQSDLFKSGGWMPTENQGSIGSCQGQSLSECSEYCFAVKTNKALQFSRMYAYIRSQQFDNIRTDSGSTLSGGTKAAREGLPTEKTAPHTSRYPGWGYITDAMREEAKNYRLSSHTEIKQESEVKSYIGSGAGIVQIGISWGRDMTPDSSGCIRSFTGAGGGGHAVVFCGYVPDADVGQRSSKGYWYLLKNSWGTRWGVGGFAYVDPSAVAAMLRHRWTVMYGRSDLSVPEVRKVPYDFTKGKVIQI